MEGGNPPACLVALDYLQENEVKPVSECLPPGSTSIYIPARKISKLFEDEPHGLTLERLFLCPCYRCVQDGGSVEDRSTRFNKLREQELRGEYSLMYALLIYIHRPALIRKFQRHELKLEGTMYLRDSDFDKLGKENIFNLHVVRRKVLEKQYSFLVRILKPLSDITAISAKELLPINEDLQPKGTGTFAEVWCFAFQYDEYRSREFGEHITRFARKIFKQGMGTSAAKEWNNLQRLSKEENHPHLMVALGAYWHGNQFFILQEEAEQSLHDYLQGEGEEFESDELWKQMKGVADGLATLHKLYKGTKIAYHQDLKPANILILKRRLKIADFGLLEFKPISLDDDTGSTGIPNAHNTGYYAAPRQGKYTRDSDIWSLGCIMSELATCDIQGRDSVKSYKEARIADGSSGKDTPRFFSGQLVKDSVLKTHNLLYNYVRSEVPAGRTAMSMQFQKNFYTKDFFDLMNSMFRKMDQSTYLLEVLIEPAVPDAGRVAETIERLRSAAVPASALDDEIQNLTLQRHLLDTDVLGTSFEAQLTGFKEILNPQNRKKFPNTTLADLKQCIVNLQAKQHAERRQQGLKRLIPFLEGFQHFSEIIKGLPGATEFMSFIWVGTRLTNASDLV
ncbi:hypothetical protein SLS60_010005 [Paraconiothyrium brasiliense]|uniref:non-specific serine/threonine protein kinase n=1 Tax=Paraconiothyrium brasiliense TaxID=300254 RepID=A0ABR3QT34_9PLEO